MQYVLTEEEHKALKDEANAARIEKQKQINDLCIQVAMYKPVVTWRNNGKPTPWGCPHAPTHIDCEGNGDCKLLGCECDEYMEYCDECPVQDICTLSKDWSQ